MPDFSLEIEFGAQIGSRPAVIIGLDEAGRGPWAGPVVAAAVWLDPRRNGAEFLDRLDDSKKLSPAARERLQARFAEGVRAGICASGLGLATVAEIDDINILQASLKAMTRAVADLRRRSGLKPHAALVDGNRLPALSCPGRAVIGGDGRSLSIAAASIVAKVARDRTMADLARRYPGYGWERNRGYGTAEHRAALLRLGVSPEHRRSFRPVREALSITR